MTFIERFLTWNWSHPDMSLAMHFAAILCLFVLIIIVYHIKDVVRDSWR